MTSLYSLALEGGDQAVAAASGMSSLAWLLVALPLLGAALLLLLGRVSDSFGPILATILSWSSFAVAAAIVVGMLGQDPQARAGQDVEGGCGQLRRAQCGGNVGHQVGAGLDADRQAQQAVGNAGLGARLGAHGRMGHRGRMRDQAFHAAERLGQGEPAQRIDEGAYRALGVAIRPGGQLEAEHRTEAGLLARGDRAYARALDDDELEVYENLRAAEVTLAVRVAG